MSTSRPQCATAQAVAAVSIEAAPDTERAKHLPLDLGRVTRDARMLANVSQELLAKLSGAPRAWIQRWEKGENGPRVDHLLRAPRAYRRAVVRELARFDGDVVHEGNPDGLDHAARNAVLCVELTDVLRVYSVALPDGLCAAERVELRKQMQEAKDALARAIAALDAEGV
jgi:transcriptional regulator with XRE-family HTH domain